VQFVALELARLCDGLGGDEFGIAQRRAPAMMRRPP
jgi:hypothetical protein